MPPFTPRDTELYRKDVKTRGNMLSVSEREALLKKYLPPTKPTKPQLSPDSTTERTVLGHRQRIRPYLRSLLHLAIHLCIQFVFGVYIRIRQIFNAVIQKFLSIRHYHHRTPAYIQKDTQTLSRLPQHLSVLLEYNSTADDGAGLEVLIDEVAELTVWSTAAGIPLLSVYEKTGILKTYMAAVQELVHQKLVQYFGAGPQTPTLHVQAPNLPAPPPMIPASTNTIDDANGLGHTAALHINLLLLSATDGRDTLVDLTRTLTEMSQHAKISPKDITSTLINTEMNATISISSPSTSPVPSSTELTNGQTAQRPINGANGIQPEVVQPPPSEPDLLIVFAPYVKLDGYPPWQVRLTEIYCVGDSGGDVSGRGSGRRTRVEYQGFLRGLWKFAGAEMRFGR